MGIGRGIVRDMPGPSQAHVIPEAQPPPMGAPTPVMDGMNGHIPHPGKSQPLLWEPQPL